MGFVLHGLESESYDRTYSDRELLRRVAAYFRPYWRQMVVVAVAISLNSIAGSGGPILISRAIDIVNRDASTTVILLLAGGVLLLGLSAWVFNFIQQMFSARVVGNVVLKLRQDAFDAVVEHDLSFYDEHPSGKVVSRVTSDTQDFSEVVSLLTSLLSQIMLVGFLTAWLLRISVPLTLILLAMSPLAVLLALSFRRLARRVTQNARRVTALINAQIQESISGIIVAKAFRQERAIYSSFATNNRQAYRVGIQRGLTLNAIFPVLGMASGIGIAALVYAGGFSLEAGNITTGNWYLFMQAVMFFWWPMISIASFWSQFQDGLSASERVFALIDAEPKVVQTGRLPVERLAGHIEFRRLGFRYTDKESVLDDFSLDIRPGERVALVGHTGAGKSSIARLITRFYEYQRGELLVDGVDIRRLDLQQYRRHVGLVPQEPFLFSGTVRENIRYGLPGATDEQVAAAARGVSGGEWVDDLPDGLKTDVGERGSNLSMGQRQLVALARILLKNPAIFILDEATASVDPFTESQIQEGLETVMQGRTAVIIAHRLSTVRSADRIIVLDHGRIIEEGSHAELLARGGHYAELYNTYFRHQSLDYRPWEDDGAVQVELEVGAGD
jgi:ATP-binding cassette, subfamily B, bacterial